ncbi:MAG: septum formation protein Maf [Clostridiales bacterium]|nr:septum formation protein Maf [Clostridiales bacterium]
MYKIVLASASPRRKEIFEKVGIEFTVSTSDKEETIRKKTPEEIVVDLASKKAEDVAIQYEGNVIVIGADTMVVHKAEIMGKPRDAEDAKRMLHILSDSVHKVYTGVSVIIKNGIESANPDKVLHFTECTDVWVKEMTEDAIADYIASGEPFGKAGAYAIQGLFAVHIDRIDGDYNNIVGFPIAKLYSVLLKEGIDILHP